ncbi:uncharacterized protein LOC136038286 isoform X2 [Artemia franciscana]|uniref:uncharacterized protein LOC136038286 isoform X2 n=1 Tax=Artemia franciscana TaxID=6661 RepID=UPI0032DB806C
MSVPSVALILEHLKIDRTGLTCPKPQYPKSYWYQPDPKSCCQECKILEPTQSTKKYEKDGEQDEEAQPRNGEKLPAVYNRRRLSQSPPFDVYREGLHKKLDHNQLADDFARMKPRRFLLLP